MNYLAVFILVIVVIFLLEKKQVVEYKEKDISKEDLIKVQHVKENFELICTKKLKEEEILDRICNAQTEYVLLSKNESVTVDQMNLIIYNFVLQKEMTCGFDVLFYTDKDPKILKNILTNVLVACINYVQMLRKGDIYSYHFVCMKKECLKNGRGTSVKLKNMTKIQSFELSVHVRKKITDFRLKEFILKRSKLKISNILNFDFVILAGTVVTANLIYNLNAVIYRKASIYDVLSCILIYICYSNLLKKVYSPMGRFKFIASYLFPIYIGLYFVLTAYYYIKKVVGEMLNKKREFLISLIILLIIYIIFILLKH